MNKPAPKRVVWMGDSLERLRAFPATVQDEVGYALYLAQIGEKHPHAKPLRGLSSGVLEVVSDHRGNTFRAVYAVRFQERVYVLHAFQKKSKKGIATPRPDIELLKQRLARAAALDAAREH
jgi:phage-related protein